MDPRLLEAAQKGDVGLLNDLIRSNALIVEEAALQGDGNTPLHVACVAGHLNFVRELLELIPKLGEKVNADGFSPLHIAAARGDVGTVREILKAGQPQHLCLVKGREGRIPLHCAAANGEISAMMELLSASPESIEETTAREETALHLAVKNNRFYALFVLVEHLKQHNKEEVINGKDKKGNTVLHLAAAAKNFEVVDFMLSGHALRRKVMEVNALNETGSTPLDVSSDLEIGEILMRAGAKHGQSNSSSSQTGLVDNYLDKARSDLLVVAALIASATYQSLLQPPSFAPKADNSMKKGFRAAFATVMTSPFMRNVNYLCFVSGNTFGFFVSVLMIICLTRKLPLKQPMTLSMVAMVYTYFCFMWYMPFSDALGEKFSLKIFFLLGGLPMVISFVLLLAQRKIAQALDSWVPRLPWDKIVGDMYSLRSASSHR